MDISEMYANMCEAAEEIQDLMPNGKDADHFEQACFYHTPKGGTAVLEYPDFPDGRIWLPRQDQLQEMVKDKYPKLNELAYFFWSWMERNAIIEIQKLISMEQLWLAFVMEENNQKVWDDGKWVVIVPTKIGI